MDAGGLALHRGGGLWSAAATRAPDGVVATAPQRQIPAASLWQDALGSVREENHRGPSAGVTPRAPPLPAAPKR